MEPSLETLMHEAAKSDWERWHRKQLAKEAESTHRKNMSRLIAYAKKHPECEIAGLDKRDLGW